MATIRGLIVHLITSAVTGTEAAIDVETDNRDRIRWEMTSRREQWPQPTEAPFLWATFLAFSALKRAGDLPEHMKFDEFNEATPYAEAEPVDVDPTKRATGVA